MAKKPTRQEIWYHNGLLGRVGMAKSGMQAILNADTATETSKALARDIQAKLERLGISLRTRKDHLDG